LDTPQIVQELLLTGCPSDSANFFLPVIQKAWLSDVIKFIPILDLFFKAGSTCNFHFKLFLSSYDKSSTAIILQCSSSEATSGYVRPFH
jgi:hypothetical protein